MIYSEASYFDGYHFHHISAWIEARRVRRIQLKALAIMEAGR